MIKLCDKIRNVPVWGAAVASDNCARWYVLAFTNSVAGIFGEKLRVAVSHADNEGNRWIIGSTIVFLL